jgi:hypothetical protein
MEEHHEIEDRLTVIDHTVLSCSVALAIDPHRLDAWRCTGLKGCSSPRPDPGKRGHQHGSNAADRLIPGNWNDCTP